MKLITRVRMVTVYELFPGYSVVRGSMDIAPTTLKSVERQKVEAQSGFYHEGAARPKFTSRLDQTHSPSMAAFVAIVANLSMVGPWWPHWGFSSLLVLSGVLGHSSSFADGIVCMTRFPASAQPGQGAR